MDISFYTFANALGITCAAAAFLIFLRRTARNQQDNEDRDEQTAQSDARPVQSRDADPARARVAQTGQTPCASPGTGDDPTPGKRP